MGRPLTYKTPDELQTAIDKYFADCDGKLLRDEDGTAIVDKFGNPVIVGKKPPTVTGLAYALGFKSRQALLNYQGKKAFNDTVTRAKLYIEAYCEERLFDKDGVKGATFSLERNFRNWRPDNDTNAEVLSKLDETIKALDGAMK